MAAQLFNRIGQIGVGMALAGGVVNSALFNVEGGQRAVIFDRFSGIKETVVGEGTHFMIPWVQSPIIFDIRARPKNVPTITGSKDLQNVNITLRILFRPRPEALPKIYSSIGVDYDDRILPSITNEVLKAVVADSTLRTSLQEENSSPLASTKNSTFLVEKAEQIKKASIIAAEGDTEAADLLSKAFIKAGEGLVELRRIETAEDISAQLSASRNVIYLPNGQSTLLNLPQ
ncbi:PHB1 [Lepeophtheirus salmonis]|uniref:Prohibitin n=1 Tax=Lepeophtheirus salmonis TaxID=72036 RepID=A0A7R8CBS5_LEPSM|nr:PHB1 [Lepeophtheirus salmonis]CAF2760865.1 PHB1 [Lepeophtheirus salmonis]